MKKSENHYRKADRSLLQKSLDFLFFPIRALFFRIKGKFGLSSLRDERMFLVASFCKGRVLDVGCGPGNKFINDFIGSCNGLGVDVFGYGALCVIGKLDKYRSYC